MRRVWLPLPTRSPFVLKAPPLSRCFASQASSQQRSVRDEETPSASVDNVVSSLGPEAEAVPTKKKRGRPPKSSSPPPLPIPTKPQSHNSLSTFLAHATKTSLSPTSTVYTGTLYEYVSLHTLSRIGLSLTRVGRANDLGIDLLGTWTLPCHSSTVPIRVLAQCKAESPKPSHVRELEGAVRGAPAGWRGEGVMALLVARGAATKGVREALGRAGGAMGFCFVEMEGSGEDAKGMIRQVLWNKAAGERLEGVGVGVRYGEDGEEEIGLTWEGRIVPSMGI